MSREKVYICTACARTARTPHNFSDVSCALNCVQVYKDSIKRDVEVGGVHYSTYIEDGGVVDPQPDWGEK